MLNDSLLFDDISWNHSFSPCHLTTPEAIHNAKFTVFISQNLLQLFIIKSGMWLIQENLKDTVSICNQWARFLGINEIKMRPITHNKRLAHLISFRSSRPDKRCSAKKVLLEISQNTQENTCARVSVLIKLQACNLQLY